MRRWTYAAAILVLAGCSKRAPEETRAAPAAVSADAAADMRATSPAGDPRTGEARQAAPIAPPSPARLAYAYAFTLSLPGQAVESMLNRHQQACITAGPLSCQVVGASLDREGRDIASAHLSLRATQDWINGFRGGLGRDLQKVGGQLDKADTATEDLDRSLVDTEADLRAKTALRDRIQQIVDSRPGKVADVIEAQKDVSLVQGEIDTARSELAVMRTRVAMSQLSLTYRAQGVAAPDGVDRPLRVAANGFVRHAVAIFAGALTLASFVLPLGLLGAPFIALTWWLNRRSRPAARTGSPPGA